MEETEDRGLGDVTQLLVQAGAGDRAALDRMLPLVYAELRRVARGQLRRERDGHTLGISGLVNEAYLKLIDQARVDWKGREHFYAVAAKAMRQILVDYARKHNAQKRGAGIEHTTIDHKQLGIEAPIERFMALEEALQRMDKVDVRMRRIVEYRFFCGLTEKETADLLKVNVRTVQREWIKARAWLYNELYPSEA
ncbi:MAG: sigma-70 family RNA polymerase sigma factor [bacterium]|nr:sigma-70 family RNA polymerase sigma factor [bacterium]